jgi:hypothetical protein
MPQIHLIDGEMGGVGKSLFTRVLSHYCAEQKKDTLIVDADRSSYNVARFYKEARQSSFSEVDYNKTDLIWDEIEEKNRSVIVNLPAGAHEFVKQWLQQDNLIELGKEMGRMNGTVDPTKEVRFVKWFLCIATPDSIQKFLASVEEYKNTMTHILVRNQGLSTPAQWQAITNMVNLAKGTDKPLGFAEALTKTLDLKHVQQISLPKFLPYERDKLDQYGLTFAEALTNNTPGKRFKTLELQRIKTFIKQAISEIDHLNGIAFGENSFPKFADDTPKEKATGTSSQKERGVSSSTPKEKGGS